MPRRKAMSYFSVSLWSFAVALPLGYWLGGLPGVWVVFLLSILEVSLSLDNAVVNAKILQNWDAHWRRIFLVYGLPVAVFGMRLVFPILIVAFATGLGSMEVLRMAMYEPDAYSRELLSSHHQIASFGGAFLLMVFLKFFVDIRKKTHWIEAVEKRLTKLGRIEAIEMAITLLIIFGIASFMGDLAHKHEFIIAGVWGLIVYILAKGFGSILGKEDGESGGALVRQGVGGFLYLEILDASFSFDGVVGAFALSNNLFVITVGLGVGALFVRSFTIYLVDRGTMGTYRYLEHGAFWAIGALAIIMFLGAIIHIPEAVTGILGALLIGISFWHSYVLNKRGIVRGEG